MAESDAGVVLGWEKSEEITFGVFGYKPSDPRTQHIRTDPFSPANYEGEIPGPPKFLDMPE